MADTELWADEYEEETCPECHGLGYLVVCCDDICASSDHCIHGDGEEVCHECDGEGFIQVKVFGGAPAGEE